jgi:hypothetical protein
MEGSTRLVAQNALCRCEGHRVLPRLVAQLVTRANRRNGDIVDQHVHPAELRQGGSDHRSGVRLIGARRRPGS